jgi:diaminopimelate epimerase
MVRVDMGAPVFALEQIPFDASNLQPETINLWQKWPLALAEYAQEAPISIAVLSMGNPHAVLLVDDVEAAPVLQIGPLIESHARFPQRVNAGFMQVLSRAAIRLRVYERGVGETLACGSGACAAVAVLVARGRLGGDREVAVDLPGGRLRIRYDRAAGTISMGGPAAFVFEATMQEGSGA